MGRKLSIAAACMLMSATAGQAQSVTAKNPQSVVNALQKAGYQASLETVSDEKLPVIRSASSGSRFSVYFYGCTGAANCAAVQFHTSYDADAGKGPALTKINDWNRDNRFGRAYLDKEGDPMLEMDVNLDDGGMSELLFTDNLEFWVAIMADFEKHIDW